MQSIASTLNFPETTFIISDTVIDEGYDVRIFTPKAEVDFAGHPVLGIAFIILKYIMGEEVKQVKLNLKIGQIRVEIKQDELWMEQMEPTFGNTLGRELLADVLSIAESEIDSDYPIVEVSTGLPFTIVPLKTRESLAKVRIVNGYYNEFVTRTSAKGILVFAPGGHEEQQKLSVRVFVPYLGIPEDPATGSANGCLAAYLIKYKYFGGERIDIQVGQGYEMGRNAQLSLQAVKEMNRIKIRIGGKVIVNARGDWFSKGINKIIEI